jgi:hypothetical protein
MIGLFHRLAYELYKDFVDTVPPAIPTMKDAKGECFFYVLVVVRITTTTMMMMTE